MPMYLLTRNEVQYRINLNGTGWIINISEEDAQKINAPEDCYRKTKNKIPTWKYTNGESFQDDDGKIDQAAQKAYLDFIKNILTPQKGDKLENLENLASNNAWPMSEDDQKTYENEVLKIFPDLKDSFEKTTTYELTRDDYTYTILFDENEGLSSCSILLPDSSPPQVLENYDDIKFEVNSSGQRVYSSKDAENIYFIGNLLTPEGINNLEKVEGTERIIVVEKSIIKNTEEFDVYHNKSLKIISDTYNQELTKGNQTQRNLNIFGFVMLALLTAAFLALTILTAGAAAGVFVPGAIGFLAAVGATSAALGSTTAFTLFTMGAIVSAILTGLSLFAAVKAFPRDPAQPSSPSSELKNGNPDQFQPIMDSNADGSEYKADSQTSYVSLHKSTPRAKSDPLRTLEYESDEKMDDKTKNIPEGYDAL